MKKYFLLILLITVTIHSASAQYQGILSFRDTTGSYPFGSLIFDGTFLYGMTYEGGTNNMGTIFKIMPNGTGFVKLHTFTGTTSDGSNPYGSLISVGTYLYGMTINGGANTAGVIFKIKPDGTGFAIVHDFDCSYGCSSKGSLISDGTFLYGMAAGGGLYSRGVVFKIKPDGTNYTVLHDFTGTTDGGNPWGDLTMVGSYLYGMTSSDGIGYGTIFKIKPDGTSYSVLYNFNSMSGVNPHGSLVSDGNYLYGMCRWGGTSWNCGTQGCGTIFRIKTDGTLYTDLINFDNSNGFWPEGSLLFDSGILYGMTWNGGTANGTIYKILPDGTDFTTLYSFDYAGSPYGSLISDGTWLYGMTNMGGAMNLGVIFKYHAAGMGTSQERYETGLKVYPDPTDGQFTVYLENKITIDKIEIYNVVGEKKYSVNNNMQQSMLKMDISDSPNGLYFLKIYKGGQCSTGIIIKQ